MTHSQDPRLEGRYQEFARMSLRPGIGYGALHELASIVLEHEIFKKFGDVPTALNHGGRHLPLGRYLRRHLRKLVGEEQNAPEATLNAAAAAVQELYQTAAAITADKTMAKFRQHTFKNLVIDANAPRAGQMINRAQIFKQRRSL